MPVLTAQSRAAPPPDCEVRAGCPNCGVTHWHWTPQAFAALRKLFAESE